LQVLLEFREYATEVDVEFVRRAVRAIGRCAISIEKAAERCINVLLELIHTRVNYVVQEAVVVIKDIFRCLCSLGYADWHAHVFARCAGKCKSACMLLLWLHARCCWPATHSLTPPTARRPPRRRYPNRYESVIATLCENLESLDEPEAKAAMVWIVGEYAERIDNAGACRRAAAGPPESRQGAGAREENGAATAAVLRRCLWSRFFTPKCQSSRTRSSECVRFPCVQTTCSSSSSSRSPRSRRWCS
jgi:vesicle coat complex subunit